jgi:CRAL/TRIO domain
LSQLATKRLIRYWSKRIEVFGPDRAFLPLTLTQALVDDEIPLKIGFARLIEGTFDPIGRGVMLVDPSKLDKTKYSRESMVRAMWYTIHAALEVESTQRYGLVAISFPRNAKFSQFDRELVKMILESLKGYLPVRLSAIHICHPPSFLRIIFPIMKVFLGERLRKRVRVHGGSEHQVLSLLADFGLLKEMLPVEIGGDKVVDQEKWLQSRIAEGK